MRRSSAYFARNPAPLLYVNVQCPDFNLCTQLLRQQYECMFVLVSQTTGNMRNLRVYNKAGLVELQQTLVNHTTSRLYHDIRKNCQIIFGGTLLVQYVIIVYCFFMDMLHLFCHIFYVSEFLHAINKFELKQLQCDI